MGSYLSSYLSPSKDAAQPQASKTCSRKPRRTPRSTLMATFQGTYLGKYLSSYLRTRKAVLQPSAQKHNSVRLSAARRGELISNYLDRCLSTYLATRKTTMRPFIQKYHSLRPKRLCRNAVMNSSIGIYLDKCLSTYLATRKATVQRFVQKHHAGRPGNTQRYAGLRVRTPSVPPDPDPNGVQGAIATPAPSRFPRKLSLWLPVRPDYPGGEYNHYLKHRIWSPQVLSPGPEPDERPDACPSVSHQPSTPQGEAECLFQGEPVQQGQRKFNNPPWFEVLHPKRSGQSPAPRPSAFTPVIRKGVAQPFRPRPGPLNRNVDATEMMERERCSFPSACPACCPTCSGLGFIASTGESQASPELPANHQPS
ncbi:uncharacterized protein LOC125344173 [Perognathus longimembris pacificus]|uniref:uncharacterized protein LOC125344173 n=1 Tax=Perognathus longimembris pacificus TaxID=214514 RepID=UPI002018D47D|nr:uncharacterized protein LOC125344173 [Perognathus longimembris pacificus]XP_048192748.1 uncharacterized protein LOC125344173 [Perognathus longimembris pacificus]XP_048192749.1 uncharacterized protein LOC125344173 [Perognathus longimembris pacificus]